MLPEPWSSVLAGLLGPYGVIVALALSVFFLWRLFREEQKENRANFTVVSSQSEAITALTTEIREWRNAGLAVISGRRK